MDECIDSQVDARVFSTLNTNWEYWQVRIDEPDRDKTTYTSHVVPYRFILILFGFKNASVTFRRAIDVLLNKCCWQFAILYLDDVIISRVPFRMITST